MRLVVTSLLNQPGKFLTSLGYAPHLFRPHPAVDVTASDPTTYGSEVLAQYLKESLISHKKSTILCLESFLTYRQRRLKMPKFKMDALEILKMLSGHTFSLMTYWTLKRPAFKEPVTGWAETKITLKPLKDQFLTSYVNDHNVIQTPLILDFTDPQTYTLITHFEGSLNNWLYFLPIESIDLSSII